MSNDDKAQFSIEENKPVDWFEPLYAGANAKGEGVPWANMAVHPSFDVWLKQSQLEGAGKSALVVGCGMGDDAIALEKLGFQVTAFDVSESAIKLCQERFPQSAVNFVQADLLKEQAQWQAAFDFVLEIFTVQALPPKFEQELIQNISSFVALTGQLLVVADVSEKERSFDLGPPWLLTAQHVDSYESYGLTATGTHIELGPESFGDLGIYITSFNGKMA